MRYHFFLHYGWFFQNLEKDFIPILLHMTVVFHEITCSPNMAEKIFFYYTAQRFNHVVGAITHPKVKKLLDFAKSQIAEEI